jgi:exosortase family protein XrtF
MILFVAFLLAFKAPLKNYLWFIPLGLFILHVSNIIRIASIGKINAHIPEWSQAAHDYLFPAWIYGTVILLWIVWVKYLSK